jgi:hypothetical protein
VQDDLAREISQGRWLTALLYALIAGLVVASGLVVYFYRKAHPPRVLTALAALDKKTTELQSQQAAAAEEARLGREKVITALEQLAEALEEYSQTGANQREYFLRKFRELKQELLNALGQKP